MNMGVGGSFYHNGEERTRDPNACEDRTQRGPLPPRQDETPQDGLPKLPMWAGLAVQRQHVDRTVTEERRASAVAVAAAPCWVR